MKRNIIALANRQAKIMASRIRTGIGEVSVPTRSEAMKFQDQEIANIMFLLRNNPNLKPGDLNFAQIKALDMLIEQSSESTKKRVDMKTAVVKENALDNLIKIQEVEIPAIERRKNEIINTAEKEIDILEQRLKDGEIDYTVYIELKNEKEALMIQAHNLYLNQVHKAINNPVMKEAIKISINNPSKDDDKISEPIDANFSEKSEITDEQSLLDSEIAEII